MGGWLPRRRQARALTGRLAGRSPASHIPASSCLQARVVPGSPGKLEPAARAPTKTRPGCRGLTSQEHSVPASGGRARGACPTPPPGDGTQLAQGHPVRPSGRGAGAQRPPARRHRGQSGPNTKAPGAVAAAEGTGGRGRGSGQKLAKPWVRPPFQVAAAGVGGGQRAPGRADTGTLHTPGGEDQGDRWASREGPR